MRGPVHQTPAEPVGRPCGVGDLRAVTFEPAAHQPLGDRGTLGAADSGGKVAQPGEALDMRGECGARAAVRAEIDIGQRDTLAAAHHRSFGERAAGLGIARQRVVGHRKQFERIASAQPQAVQRRAPGQPMKTVGKPLAERQPAVARAHQPLARRDLAGRVGGHEAVGVAVAQEPRNPAMLVA